MGNCLGIKRILIINKTKHYIFVTTLGVINKRIDREYLIGNSVTNDTVISPMESKYIYMSTEYEEVLVISLKIGKTYRECILSNPSEMSSLIITKSFIKSMIHVEDSIHSVKEGEEKYL